MLLLYFLLALAASQPNQATTSQLRPVTLCKSEIDNGGQDRLSTDELNRLVEECTDYVESSGISDELRAEILSLRAQLKLVLKDRAGALLDAETAREILPDHILLQLVHAKALASTGQAEASLNLVSDLLRQSPKNPSALALKAQIELFQHSNIAAARHLTQQAIDLKPTHARALFLSSKIAEMERNFEEAVARIDDFIQATPNGLLSDPAVGHRQKGVMLHNLQRYQEALASFTTATLVSPDDYDAWRGVWDCQVCLRRLGSTILAAEKMQSLAPERSSSIRAMARSLMWNQSYSKAIPLCELWWKNDKSDSTPLVFLAVCRSELGDQAGAVQIFKTANAQFPNDRGLELTFAVFLATSRGATEESRREAFGIVEHLRKSSNFSAIERRSYVVVAIISGHNAEARLEIDRGLNDSLTSSLKETKILRQLQRVSEGDSGSKEEIARLFLERLF